MSHPEPTHEGTVARTFLALGSGEAIGRVVSFGALVWLARVLGVDAFGSLELAAAIVIYGNRIADLGFDLGLGVRETAAGDAGSRARLLSTALILRTGMALAVIAVLAGVGLAWLPEPEGRVLALYSLTLLAVGLGTRWLHLGFERSRLPAIARVAGDLVTLGAVLWFVRDAGDLLRAPLSRLAGDLLAALVLLAGARRLLTGSRDPAEPGTGVGGGFDRRLARELLPRAVPLVGGALFGLMIFNADLVMLRIFDGRTAVGYYAAAYTLISFLSNLGTAYSLSLLPALTRLSVRPGERGDLFRTAHAQVAAVGLGVATGGTLLAGSIIPLVFGTDYARSVLPLAILLWSIPLALLRDLSITALMADGRERPIVWLTGQAAATNVGLNLVLVPLLGMGGAAIATVATEGVRWWLAARAARPTGLRGPAPGRYGRAIAAAVGMAGALWLGRSLALWLAIPVGAAAWLAVLVATGAVRRVGGRFSLDV